nr:MFS transporter [Paenibacillus sp. MMS18-CY102]
MYVPILSPYLSSLGYSLAFIGIVLGSYGFVQLLIRFPIGLWSDAKGRRKPFIMLGLAAGAASCILVHHSRLVRLAACRPHYSRGMRLNVVRFYGYVCFNVPTRRNIESNGAN